MTLQSTTADQLRRCLDRQNWRVALKAEAYLRYERFSPSFAAWARDRLARALARRRLIDEMHLDALLEVWEVREMA